MFGVKIPEIYIKKLNIPVIYLDTCILIELSRYENGCCTNEYKDEIGRLYNILTDLMKNNKILCPLGNQMVEMGSTKNRSNARSFLNRFTNSELYLPNEIYNSQLDVGYYSYIEQKSNILFQLSDIFSNTNKQTYGVYVEVFSKNSSEMALQYREEKQNMVDVLNNFKHNTDIPKDFSIQCLNELQADYQVLNTIIETCRKSEDNIVKYMDMLTPILNRISKGDSRKAFLGKGNVENINYGSFLLSWYQYKLPYIYIRAILFTHLMQRSNKIKRGDNLDVKWASAYLPFVDYAITDGPFCKLLNNSGLAGTYNTKVYDFSTITTLIEDFSKYN